MSLLKKAFFLRELIGDNTFATIASYLRPSGTKHLEVTSPS